MKLLNCNDVVEVVEVVGVVRWGVADVNGETILDHSPLERNFAVLRGLLQRCQCCSECGSRRVRNSLGSQTSALGPITASMGPVSEQTLRLGGTG